MQKEKQTKGMQTKRTGTWQQLLLGLGRECGCAFERMICIIIFFILTTSSRFSIFIQLVLTLMVSEILFLRLIY